MKKTVSSFLCMLVLAIATVQSVQAQGGTTTAILTDDTYYGSPYGDIHGAEPILKVSRGFFVTFLKFDISSIPDGATGITAVLELYTEHDGVPIPRFVAVFPVDNITWTEEGYTPDEYLERYFTEKVVKWVTSDETWYEWNVTNIVAKAVSNSYSLVAFAVEYDTSEVTSPMLFTSKEGSVTKIPKLTVTWTAVIPEYSTTLFSAVLVCASSLALLFTKRQKRSFQGASYDRGAV